MTAIQRKGLRGRILALALGLVAGLGVLELAVRVAGLEPPRPGETREGQELIDWREREKNKQGFHDRAWKRAKTPGRERVLVVGDSFVEGTHVPWADLLPTRVEAHLNTQAGAEVCELFNFALRGWDTAAEVDHLRRRGLQWDPDAVLIVFFVNDATLMDTNPLVVEEFHRRLYQRDGLLNRVSKAWDYLDWKLTKASVEQEMIESYRDSYLGSRNQVERWRSCEQALAEARQLADEHGFRLGLAIFPMLLQLDGDHALSEIYDLVEETCAELGIPTCNLLPAFVGQDPSSLWVAPTDAHPNARAYELATEPLAEFLVDSGLLTSRP